MYVETRKNIMDGLGISFVSHFVFLQVVVKGFGPGNRAAELINDRAAHRVDGGMEWANSSVTATTRIRHDRPLTPYQMLKHDMMGSMLLMCVWLPLGTHMDDEPLLP